jgi:upstream activation factor subunit UAF30
MATSTRHSQTRVTPRKTKRSTSKMAGGGLAKHAEPSPQLAAIVGNKTMPRTEVTKKVWDYIKSHNLQDSQNRRMIKADDKLKEVLGGKKQVSMFELTRFVSKNLKEKQD